MTTNVLIFGGNGFIGKTTVNLLTTDAESCNILTANRGSKIWQCLENKKSSQVPWVYCDRKKDCEQFSDFVRKVGDTFYDYVIDFSGYSEEEVERTSKFMSGRCGLYIFISSDSVYEVCNISHTEPSRESDAIRPASKEEQKRLKRQDSYGHKKLCCEEVLVREQGRSGFRYLILRLADVIGPMDSTDRWWTCQLWTLLASKLGHPVVLPQEVKARPLSFVYSKDVACLIKDIIVGKYKKQELENQVYNLACTETMTMKELISELCKACSVKNVQIQFSDCDDVPHLFPSVNRGPINTSKVQGQLNWTPTPLLKTVKETADFYTQVHQNASHNEEKEDILETCIEDLSPLFSDTNVEDVLKSILWP